MRILLESLIVFVPLYMLFAAAMLWACLMMARTADREDSRRFSDWKLWHPGHIENFEGELEQNPPL